MAIAEQLDAVALLKADHRKVEDLFAKFEAAKGDGRKEALAEQICMELTIHTKIEEGVFYPACEGKVANLVGHDHWRGPSGLARLRLACSTSSPGA